MKLLPHFFFRPQLKEPKKNLQCTGKKAESKEPEEKKIRRDESEEKKLRKCKVKQLKEESIKSENFSKFIQYFLVTVIINMYTSFHQVKIGNVAP